MKPVIEDLIKLLGISENEAAKALLSAFSPCQPGSLRQSWINRKGYEGAVPATPDIWALFAAADFCCSACNSRHRITLDHINNEATDHRLENLQVLCADCNRAKNKRGVIYKDTTVRIYNAVVTLYQRNGVFPSGPEIVREAGITQLAGASYLVRFLEHRLTGGTRRLRAYRSSIYQRYTGADSQAELGSEA